MELLQLQIMIFILTWDFIIKSAAVMFKRLQIPENSFDIKLTSRNLENPWAISSHEY